MSKKVWIRLQGKEKPMLVELDNVNLQALDNNNTIIRGIRTNQSGVVSKVGFNTSNMTSYEYPEAEQQDDESNDEDE